MRFSQEICARLLQSSDSSFRAEAIGKKPQCLAGYWKEVTVFRHVDLSTVLPDCRNNTEVGLSGSEKARRMSQCFFWSGRRSQHTITMSYSYALEDSLKGEELSSTSCKQFTDKVRVARSHKRILNSFSYLRFTNSIHEISKQRTNLESVLYLSHPTLEVAHRGSCNWYSCQQERFGNGFLETPPSDNGVWLKLFLWCYENTTYDFSEKRADTEKAQVRDCFN